MSSDVDRCVCIDGSVLVVRHITDRAWLTREPDLIEREATALRLLAGAGVPAPGLVAADVDGGRLLMTSLGGAVVAGADELRAGAWAIGEVAASIAAVELPADHGLPSWQAWVPVDPSPPTWGDGGLWREAIDAYWSRPLPSIDRPVLLHRDLHPLNLLWAGDRVVGVVDWVNACVGHPHAELGHCRWNLSVLVDQPAAEAFLAANLTSTGGVAYDPWWDLCAALGHLPGPIRLSGWHAVGRLDLDMSAVIAATERFVTAALGRW